MKRLLYIILCIVLACACTKTVVITDPYSSGVCVGEILLGSQKGKLSISVETKDNWRIESDSEWLVPDTDGRTRNGAFTVYYTTNESNVQSIKSTRTARLVIHVEESMKADTIYFVQRGLYPVSAERKVMKDPALTLEYNLPQEQTLILLCCSSEGTADVDAVIAQLNPDITVKDGILEVKEGLGNVTDQGATKILDVSGLKVLGCNYAGMTEEQEYQAFRSLVNTTYNAGPGAGDNWIFAGQMYHLSSMMIGYKDTPHWYPTSSGNPRFRADVFAWQNNLYDCVWMYYQKYIATYTDSELGDYSADYVYASPAVFSKIEAVEVLDVEGLAHKPIKVTLKY